MVMCCVPFCKSTKGKTQGISYHEFPVAEELRAEWLRRISRKDFTVNQNSNTSVVCSNHFVEKDYEVGEKIRRLKKGSVPSVFSEYPSYMIPIVSTVKRLASREKNNYRPTVKKQKVTNAGKARRLPLSDITIHSSTNSNTTNNALTNRIEVEEENIDLTCSPTPSTKSFTNTSMQTDVDNLPAKLLRLRRDLNTIQVQKWRLNQKMQNLQEKLDQTTKVLKDFENNQYHIALKHVLAEAEASSDKSMHAFFLMDQLINFKKKLPRYSCETTKLCVIWHHISPRAYNFVRREKFLKLPSKSTLTRYLGDTSSETGVTSLIKQRLCAEINTLKPAEKFVSLIIDEMDLKPQLQYDRKIDAFFGERDTKAHIQDLEGSSQNEEEKAPIKKMLANRLLCFVLTGLSTRYKIPCAFFFSKQLSGLDLFKLTKSVIKEVEEAGFFIIRIVTDNHSVNVTMMKHLCGGCLTHIAPHPFQEYRKIFLSFDQNHLIKKLWTLLLEKKMTDGKEDINGRFVKMLYEMQVNDKCSVRPVRCLTRKHVDPSNFEKMNVERAVRFFSQPVIATLQYLHDHPFRHPEGHYFADCGATIKFMRAVQQWFDVHNISNRTHHIASRNENKMHFFEVSDKRLDWLLNDFLQYMKQLNEACKESNLQFLTKETYNALVLTTKSTVQCIKYLLENGFEYVLTQSFNSDPVEVFFGALRQMSGCNDMLDCRAVVFSMDKVLKTGILSAPSTCNAQKSSITSNITPTNQWTKKTGTDSETQVHDSNCRICKLPNSVMGILENLNCLDPQRTTMTHACIAMVSGYLVNVVEKQLACFKCLENVSMPRCTSALLDMISNQDNGGCHYPKPVFVKIICVLVEFTDRSVPILCRNDVQKTLKNYIMPKLLKCERLVCSEDPTHTDVICNLICDKLLPALLKNIGKNVSENMEKYKYLNSKPLNRKLFRLH